MCTKAPEFCSRKCAAQARLMLNEPLRWTVEHVRPVRPAHAGGRCASRRMPALLTRMSTRPKASSAALHDLVGVLRLGDRERRGDRLAAALLDLVDHLPAPGPASVPAPSQARADVADHDARALLRQQQRDARARCRARAPVTMATLSETMPGVMLDVLSCNESSQRVASRDMASEPGSTGHLPYGAARVHSDRRLRDDHDCIRQLVSCQPHTSSATSTIIRSFAHCSSSASMLPSSVEAKPHCGESAELVESDEFRRLVDAALERRPWLSSCAGLGGDEAEHHGLALRHEPQRLEAAGALGVVLHEIAVHVDAC